MKKLRLLITEACPKNCEKCCNKQIDLTKLPRVHGLEIYDEVIITGGEPMLFPMLVLDIVKGIRVYNKTSRIYVQTSLVLRFAAVEEMLAVLAFVDGITVTVHDREDVVKFLKLDSALMPLIQYNSVYTDKSFRLNIFEGAPLEHFSNIWQVKRDIKWLDNCPLPEGEEFMRL